MWPQGVPRMIVPPIQAQRFAVWIERIDSAVLGFVPFAHHEQADLRLGVVEEAMRGPG